MAEENNQEKHDDLDSYVVADMSAVEKPALLRFRLPQGKEDSIGGSGRRHSRVSRGSDAVSGDVRVKEQSSLPPGQTGWYMLGALRAGLLIAGAFILGLGIVILVMVLAF